MSNVGIFLLEPNINKQYSLMFTKTLPFIKIFGKEILIWSIKKTLEDHKNKKCDLYIHITEYNKNDICLMIEKISEGHYNILDDFKFFCKNIDLVVTFIFDIDILNKIKNSYEKNFYEYKIGKLSEDIDLNNITHLNNFFTMTYDAAYRYFYVPEHEQKKFFRLYDKIV